MRTRTVAAALGVAALLSSYAAAGQAQNKIDFEAPAVSTPPPPASIAFANRGILLPRNPNAQVVELPSATSPVTTHSGRHALVSAPPAREFDDAPLVVQFIVPVSSVSFYTGTPADTRGQTVTVMAEALDARGGVVAGPATVTFIGPTNIVRPMHLVHPQKHLAIAALRVRAVQGVGAARDVGTYEYIDDLSFTTEGKPPITAWEPPHVYFTSPASETSDVMTGSVTIEGDIAGKGMFPDVAAPIVVLQWAASASAPLTMDTWEMTLGAGLSWTVTGQNLHFVRTVPLQHFGPHTITVMASNAAGVGQAVRHVTFMPQAIATEYQKEAQRLGSFVEGQTTGGCTWAVYSNGAIFSSAAGTFTSFDAIFRKWNELRVGTGVGPLGCAVTKSGPPMGHRWGAPKGKLVTIDDAAAQDFEGGRVYAGPSGAHYVAQPFVDAIDALDFVVNFGVPVSDPVTPPDEPFLPLRWQRFEPTADPDYFRGLSYSTMELAGSPPRLWIATPDTLGWIRSNFEGTILWPGQYHPGATDPLSSVPQDVPPRLPSVWRNFGCATLNGPCPTVGTVPSDDAPQWGPPTDYDEVYPKCGAVPFPRWSDFGSHPQKVVPVQGHAAASNMAGEDFAGSHYCSKSSVTACVLGALVGAPVACAYLDEAVDWTMKLAPAWGQDRVLAVNRGGDADQARIEIEYEYCLVGYPFRLGHNSVFPQKAPGEYVQKGDGLFVAGRWVVDCGHKPYNTEMHPPAAIVNWHTEPGSVPNELVTFADMTYLDWWWPNEVVSVDLYPPPRPHATARLATTSTNWASGVKTTWLPADNPNHIHLELSGRSDIPPSHLPPYVAWNGQVQYGCWADKVFGGAAVYSTLFGLGGVDELTCDDSKRSAWGFYKLGWK